MKRIILGDIEGEILSKAFPNFFAFWTKEVL